MNKEMQTKLASAGTWAGVVGSGAVAVDVLNKRPVDWLVAIVAAVVVFGWVFLYNTLKEQIQKKRKK